MKIRLLICFVDPHLGGLQVLALRVAQHLKKKGHDVRIVGRFTGSDPLVSLVRMEMPRTFTVEGVDVEIISVQGWRRWLLAPVPRFKQRPKTFRLAQALYTTAFRAVLNRTLGAADLVHYLGTGSELLGSAARTIAGQNKIPFVAEPALHVGQWGGGPADWAFYKEADMVIAHSEFEAQELRQGGVKASHVHLLRHGFDALEPGNGARFRNAHGIEGPMILFVGRRCDEKGYFVLLQAFATLSEQRPGVTLVVAGPGEIPPARAKGIIELGRVSDELRQDALSACTIFCVPSKGESFGMAYFEAWACGKPVVALDLPVLRETIGASGGGLLASPDRAGDLVEKLRSLLDQPELAVAMGARGRAFSLRYSWDAAARSCLEAYSEAQRNRR